MRRPVPRFQSRTERTNGAQKFGEATASLERFGEMVEITVATVATNSATVGSLTKPFSQVKHIEASRHVDPRVHTQEFES